MIGSGASCGFRPGEVLFQQGEVGNGVYFIRRGMTKVVVSTPDGRELTVGFAGPGETIGEMSALDGSNRSATVIAMEPVEATYVSREVFRESIVKRPETAMRLLQLLVRRLRAVDQMVATMDAAQGEPTVDGPVDGAVDGPIEASLDDRLLKLQNRIDQLGLTRDNLERYAGEPRPVAAHRWERA